MKEVKKAYRDYEHNKVYYRSSSPTYLHKPRLDTEGKLRSAKKTYYKTYNPQDEYNINPYKKLAS